MDTRGRSYYGSYLWRAAAKTRKDLSKSKGPKKDPKENASWTIEELKEDEEMLAAFTAIDKVYGHEDTKAIRVGKLAFKKADVLLLAKLPARETAGDPSANSSSADQRSGLNWSRRGVRRWKR
jgi:hypothetical protein